VPSLTAALAAERAALCDDLAAAGPDAPTLAGEWTTADLAAHVFVRERRPLALVGIGRPDAFGGRAGAATRRAMDRVLTDGYDALVERVRRPPPLWHRVGPAVLANLMELVAHHEDVRRGGATGLPPRRDEAARQDAVWRMLRLVGPVLALRGRAGRVALARPDGPPHRLLPGAHPITLRGEPVELVLHLTGRRDAARVEVEGDPDAVARFEAANLAL
jgi:uncharacterized protein (TIGR03085 family)